MSRQKSVRIYPNGIELGLVNVRLRERLAGISDHLTLADLNRIEIALRLRSESEEDLSVRDPSGRRRAGLWRGTLARVRQIIARTEAKESA